MIKCSKYNVISVTIRLLRNGHVFTVTMLKNNILQKVKETNMHFCNYLNFVVKLHM